MRGTARVFLQTLPEKMRNQYRTLKSCLEKRFGSTSKPRHYWAHQLSERMRGPDETIAEYADEVLLLAKRAYPHDMTQHNLNVIALQQMYRSLDRETRQRCIEKKCQSIAEAVEVVELFETFSKSFDQKIKRYETNTVETEQIEVMIDQIAIDKTNFTDVHRSNQTSRKKSSRESRRGIQCYICGRWGHVQRFCPKMHLPQQKERGKPEIKSK